MIAQAALLQDRIERISFALDGAAALQHHIASHTPVVISDLAANWPALQKWTPAYLSEHYGSNVVRVYNASFGKPGEHYMASIDSINFSEFLQKTLGEGQDLRMFLYNISQRIPELLKDVPFPEVGLRFSKNFVFTFFGCQGAVTPLHYDIDMGHVFYTAVLGRRRIRWFQPDQSVKLYQHPFTVRSYVDLDAPDFDQFPAFAGAHGGELVLAPGETLFLPSGFWHEFNYLDAGFGISLRAASTSWNDRLRGFANLLTLSPIDRLGNKVAGQRWFDWKERVARSRARAAQ